ncbi:hypothetical protein [Actinacidiphila sp. bgisy144]|uniref:hypothetical protein n=1 Tax=Actinacidiphila sp. bgisy144 TaxID=3413791 RepID=UPI003EB903BC
MKILGREPALWLSLVAVIVKLSTAFGLDLSDKQQAVVNAFAAAVVGLLVALTVHDGVNAAILGLVQAGMSLAIGFGLHWSADQQSTVMSLASVLIAMWTRTQVTAKVPAKAHTAAGAAGAADAKAVPAQKAAAAKKSGTAQKAAAKKTDKAE